MKTRHIILVIVTTTICFLVAIHVFWTESTKAVRQMAQGIAQDFKGAFNTTPEVTINNHVVTAESHPISELATASKTVSVETTFVSTWLHSTKYISIRGDFVAKAGFDLNDRFRIDIKTKPRLVTVSLPKPRILSLEMTSNDIIDEQGGIVNWLTPQDHEAALRQLTAEAKLDIEKSSIKTAAREEMEKRIKAIGALRDVPVIVQYEAVPEVAAKPKE